MALFTSDQALPHDSKWVLLAKILDQQINIGSGGVTGVYRGTTAQRNATIPAGTAALWVLTDSDPQYQISIWNGVAWV